MQRENKRPWPFRPRCAALVLTATGHGVTSTPVPDLDVADRCLPRRRDEREVRRELDEYLDFSRSQLRAAVDVGARDAELVVRGSGLDTEVELRFRLDGFPGTVFCRRDVPFDESGAIAGLRAWNIALDEDVECGIRRGAVEPRGPVTWI
ncbi:hypothetical protein ABZ805_28100 [Saccharopolyspora sp. NPDC047091]|uniref:hypothetical protein n=1 Tax=Saccharopolyspora sp. NPDC047091 TaxID=3155924 RepID=UPI0033F6183F